MHNHFAKFSILLRDAFYIFSQTYGLPALCIFYILSKLFFRFLQFLLSRNSFFYISLRFWYELRKQANHSHDVSKTIFPNSFFIFILLDGQPAFQFIGEIGEGQS